MQTLNHEILIWARETANLTREEAVKKLGIGDTRGVGAIDRLIAFEIGKTEPTRAVLVKMAKHYRRPLLTFYLTKPPKLANRGADFRTLPLSYEEPANKLLDTLLRDVRVRQSMVRAVLEDEDEVKPMHFVGARKISDGKAVALNSLRKLLDVNQQHYRAQANPKDAFSMLREKAEKSGIFILLKSNLGSYHTAIDVEVFRGFVIADALAPFIVINEQDAVPAWSFTLLHELVHLILGHTGISGPRGDNQEEKFCNDVASEFLLPAEELAFLDIHDGMEIETKMEIINEFARARHLSRSMVTYAAYRNGVINLETYNKLSITFRDQWYQLRIDRRRKMRKQKSQPDYYVVHQHRIGHSLIGLVHRTMIAGSLTTTKAAKILGVKPQKIQELFDKSILK